MRDQYCSSATKADYYWPAIDLLVLSGIVATEFKIEVLDAVAQNLGLSYCLNYVKKNNFTDIIALTSTASKEEDFSFFKRIKEECRVKIILNGGFLRYQTQKYLKDYEFIDCIILDYIQAQIIEFLNGQERSLGGLCYRNKNMILESADSTGAYYFKYPLPRHDLFPLKRYFTPQGKFHPFSCVLSSFGCNFNCKFCSSATIPFRLRDISNLLAELKYLQTIKIKEIHFPDFTFTANRSHCLELCQAILKENLDISWDCLTRADCFDWELAKMMKQAGCHTIQFGVETKNEKVLKDLAKPISNATTRHAFDICKKTGIETIGFFIIGLPEENEKSIKETISFAKELDCDFASFSIYVPDFGSEVRHKLLIDNPELKKIDGFDRTKFPLFETAFLTQRQIWDYRNKAIRQFYFRLHYLFKIIKRIKSISFFKTAWRIFWSMLRMQIVFLAK